MKGVDSEGLCGRTMGFYRNKDKGIRVKSCRYYGSDRVHRCPNRGGPISLIQDEINRQIVHYRS